MQGMSERQYAAHVGLSRGAIQKAKEAGRLVQHADGSIDAAASDARRAAMTDPAKQRGSNAAGTLPAAKLKPVPDTALSAGIGPVVGQNWGAKQHGRAQSATLWAFGFCVVYGAGVGVALMIYATPTSRLLASGESDLAYAAQYLRIVGLTMRGSRWKV